MKRFIFWDYPRASFPYDIMVALILAFIFLTPSTLFNDRPRTSSVAMLPGGVYLIGTEDLSGKSGEQLVQTANELIRRHFPKTSPVVKVEPLVDAEHEVKGFRAYTKP